MTFEYSLITVYRVLQLNKKKYNSNYLVIKYLFTLKIAVNIVNNKISYILNVNCLHVKYCFGVAAEALK